MLVPSQNSAEPRPCAYPDITGALKAVTSTSTASAAVTAPAAVSAAATAATTAAGTSTSTSRETGWWLQANAGDGRMCVGLLHRMYSLVKER